MLSFIYFTKPWGSPGPDTMHGLKDGGGKIQGMTLPQTRAHTAVVPVKLTSLSERSVEEKPWTDEGSVGEALCKDRHGHGVEQRP